MLTKPPRAVWDHLALVMQVGLTFVGSVLFCLAMGYWLDRWLGTQGVFITIFILLGIAGGGYTVYRQIMELDLVAGAKKDDGSSPDDDPPNGPGGGGEGNPPHSIANDQE